eukprot:TRINITY_DN38724_c0_g1_i1.p1 TRINITY_DN38724_c0_g1~~TRINITY_DN38724_c0_g1_i1.p1  ORF type:complete len:138 (+),score=24.67 TRINITY_DN38724_c0_g1_i1:30-416(+)
MSNYLKSVVSLDACQMSEDLYSTERFVQRAQKTTGGEERMKNVKLAYKKQLEAYAREVEEVRTADAEEEREVERYHETTRANVELTQRLNKQKENHRQKKLTEQREKDLKKQQRAPHPIDLIHGKIRQ